MPIKSLVFAIAVALHAFVTSCDNENSITKDDSQDIAEDALTDSYYEDADDLASVSLDASTDDQLGGQNAVGGRITETIVITISDQRKCIGEIGIEVTIEPDTDSTPADPSGKMTIDFGDGCTDIRGNTRRGKLVFVYNGRRFMPNSTVVLTPDEYYINDLKLEGTRTITNISGSTEAAPKFSIVLTNGKATFPDGSIALRQATFTREWIRASSPLNDELIIEGNASGTARSERTYTVTIQEPLVFKRNCGGLPVSGVKIFTVDGKSITIDYGDGACDRSVTYTVGDRTVTTNVGNN